MGKNFETIVPMRAFLIALFLSAWTLPAAGCSSIEDFSLDARIRQIYIHAWDTTLSRDLECAYLIKPADRRRFVVQVRYRVPDQDIRFERNLPKEYLDPFLDAYTTFESRPFGWFWFRMKRAMTRASEKTSLKVDTTGRKGVIQVAFLLEDGREFKFVSQERAPNFWLAHAPKRKTILYSERFTENLEGMIARIDDSSRKRKVLERNGG